MTDMTPRHAKGWTIPQLTLASLIVLTVTALAPLFFLDLFTTVNHLLAGSFGWWAWTVPLATEASFVTLYLLGVLLVLRGKPARWLAWAPYPFAAASLWLNVAAAHGDGAAMVGHAVLVVAFFTPLLAAKAAVRSLSVTDDEVAVGRATADARRYAMDLLRDRAGLFWRWSPKVPSLLRRQVLRGRLKASVVTAVKESLRDYGVPWEGAVREWVLGPDGLNLSAQAEVASQRAAEAIRQEAPVVPAEHPTAVPASATPGAPSRGGRQRPSQSAVQRAQRLGRKAPEALLVEAVRELFASGAPVTKYRIAKELPVGDEKAGRLLAAVRAERPPLAVAK